MVRVQLTGLCVGRSQIWVRMMRRAALLFFLGLVINSASPQSAWSAHGLRLPGVLQRFAVCSLLLASLQLPTLRAADQHPAVSLAGHRLGPKTDPSPHHHHHQLRAYIYSK